MCCPFNITINGTVLNKVRILNFTVRTLQPYYEVCSRPADANIV